ncbi:MAG: hypothetical protein GJ680_08390 [Alteromonadaceae bacterium]|nr:hypothetical protein [Alteromonadaceae bacterium]
MSKLFAALFLFLVANLVAAVELTETQYQLVKEDIKRLYQQPADSMSFLEQREVNNQLYISSISPRHGEMRIKLPIKKDHLRILQVPHAFFDLKTGEIGQQWFEQAPEDVRPDILMRNVEHRYETEKSDLSRIPKSLFTAVVDTFLEMQMQIAIIQVHGFNDARRETVSAGGADFILSNGTPIPEPYLLAVQSCLRDNNGLLARVYGRDVFELGATINPVGRLINRRNTNKASFLHIEMPSRIRTAFAEQQIGEEATRCLLGR